MKPKVALLISKHLKSRVITKEGLERLASFAEIVEEEIDKLDFDSTVRLIKDADACITCWGSITFSKELLKSAPKLKLVAHSAGSVKHLVSDDFYDRGIQITSAAAANAISVAEHTLGMIIAMLKRSFWINDYIHKNGWNAKEEFGKCKALYNIKVGIVGAGHIGRHLMKLLKSFKVEVLLYDPFVNEEEAKVMGVTKIENLNELMTKCDVISLHAPSIPQTHHMINKENMKLLMDGAIIINTARGSLIDEAALYEEAKTGRISICMDVCDPEPMEKTNPLLTLPNVILTQHTAGASFNDTSRMGDLAISELENYFSGKSLMFPVKKEDLFKMA